VLSDDGTKIDATYEWCAKGVKPQTQNLKGISIDDELSWFAKRLRNFEVIHVPCVADLRPEASDEKEYFQAQDVQSLLAIPMTYGGALVGFLGFDSARANKKWTEGIIALLGVVGEIFTNALERKRVEEALLREKDKLQAALAKIKTLSGLLPICAHCKKIRDDKGYWSQIEEYIRDHSEAQFSHGICPECAEKAMEELDRVFPK